MKNLMILAVLVLSTGIYTNICAQQAPSVSTPSVTGDKDLNDRNIKARSVELDRVEREANKTGAAVNGSGEKPSKTEDKLAVKYEEIKTDYEQIQLSQDAVIKAYQTGSNINYAQIRKSAQEINKSAARLNSNLFPPAPEEKTDTKKKEKDKTKSETKPTKNVRDLIVDLDNTIGSFVTSPMFQNLRTVEPNVSAKAMQDLEKIIELSKLLDLEARKMETNGK